MSKNQKLIEVNQDYSAQVIKTEQYYDAEEILDTSLEIEDTNDASIEEIDAEISLTENLINSIILALNTSYHVGLQNEETRLAYRTEISKSFENAEIDENYLTEVINNCYEIFLDEISLPAAIARNQVINSFNFASNSQF